MTIDTITIKLFGKKNTMFRVIDGKNGVVHVAESRDEAQAWIDAQ